MARMEGGVWRILGGGRGRKLQEGSLWVGGLGKGGALYFGGKPGSLGGWDLRWREQVQPATWSSGEGQTPGHRVRRLAADVETSHEPPWGNGTGLERGTAQGETLEAVARASTRRTTALQPQVGLFLMPPTGWLHLTCGVTHGSPVSPSHQDPSAPAKTSHTGGRGEPPRCSDLTGLGVTPRKQAGQ